MQRLRLLVRVSKGMDTAKPTEVLRTVVKKERLILRSMIEHLVCKVMSMYPFVALLLLYFFKGERL